MKHFFLPSLTAALITDGHHKIFTMASMRIFREPIVKVSFFYLFKTYLWLKFQKMTKFAFYDEVWGDFNCHSPCQSNKALKIEMENKVPLLGMTLEQLADVARQLGMPAFAAKQLAQWIYTKRVTEFDQMTNISKKHRELLGQQYTIGRSQPVTTLTSSDGTVKYLFQTSAGGFVETVFIPDRDRNTLCVSSQVGCKMNCLFCQTGKQGFGGNLTVGDIINQVLSVDHAEQLTNIVFMGQGEPFDNLDEVMKALDILTADYGLAWSPHRITVSTVGLRKNIKRFLEDSQCHLAVSLHSPIHEQRLSIMPAEKQMGIEEIVETLRHYDFSHQRRLSFEYIMFKGLNDSLTYAKALVQLLKGLDCRINLIRFHKIPNVELDGVDMDKMMAFRDYLTAHGLFSTIRASRGEDIFAACGMLNTAEQEKRKTQGDDNNS